MTLRRPFKTREEHRHYPTAPALEARCRRALREHRRRARADHQVLDYGLAELVELVSRKVTCCYCGGVLQPDTLSFDHKTPTCRKADYGLANLAVCCTPCNAAKGLLTAEEFLELLAMLMTWHPRASADVLRRLRAGGRRYRSRKD